MFLETYNITHVRCKILLDSGIEFAIIIINFAQVKLVVKVLLLISKMMLSIIIHHCHHACPQGMVPVLAQEIWKVFWNASVHVQVIWMQNDSWNESKTCKSDGTMG